MDCLIGYDTYIGSYIRESLDPNKTEYYNEDNFHELNPSVNYSRVYICLLYTSPSPRDRQKSRMPSSA